MDVDSLSHVPGLRRISLLGALVSLPVTLLVYQFFTAFTLLGVGVTVALVLFGLLGPQTTRQLAPSFPVDDPRVPGVLLVGFLLANTAAVLSLSTAYYTKPLVYYVLVAVAAGILVARILFTDANRSNVALAFVYGLNTFVSNQLAFPLGLDGPDIGDHVGLATTIHRTGHITGGGLYNGFPGQHVLASTVASFAGTPVPITYRSVGIAGMLLGLPVTYLVARRLGDRRFAVFAMIFYASMDYVVYRVGHPSKLAYALPLVLLAVAAAVHLYRESTPGMVILFGLFSTALVFTHPHTAFMTLLLFGAFAIGSHLAPRIEALRPEVAGEPTDGGRTTTSVFAARGHVFAVLFLVVFVVQFLYFSQSFDTLVTVAYDYVDVLFLSGGPDAVKSTPRFSSIPQAQLLINTIGSGLLVAFVVLGGLDLLERRIQLSYVLMTWTIVAGVVMVIGVVADVPFALPNRVWVITQITAFGFFGATGLLYLLRHARTRARPRVLVSAVLVLVVGFALFSTASTIAGIETSPFNEDVPHRTWYGMVEDGASDSFLEAAGVNTSAVRAARSFPVDRDSRWINYSTAAPGTIVGLNEHRISTGIPVEGGRGRIGGGVYAIPEAPREGLSDRTRVYDNGVVEVYRA